MLGYRIDIEPDDNGTYLVTVPALPEVTTFVEGDPLAGSHVVHDAIEEALSARIDAGADLPSGDPDPAPGEAAMIVYASPLTEAKVALYQAVRDAKVSRAELQRRMHVKSRESVDRLFRLDHASRLDQINDAFHAIGKRISIRVEDEDRAREFA